MFSMKCKMNLTVLLLTATLIFIAGGCKEDDISGCTDPLASNYDPDAVTDDGTCVYSGAVQLCGNITTDQTLVNSSEAVDYLVTCDIDISADVVVEPGTVINFKSNTGFHLTSGGSLKAAGTSALPITFKGTADVAGYWKGLFFETNNPMNELTYCVISGGGSGSFDGNTAMKANIRVDNGAQLKISNTNVSKSAKYGLYSDGTSFGSENPITLFQENTFSDNQDYPVSVIAPVLNAMDGAESIYTGNSKNKIEVRGGKLMGSHIWKYLAIPYLITSTVNIGYNTDLGNLTVERGTTIEFGSDVGLTIGDYADGYLKMIGTSALPITLTGETQVPGAWKGVCFQSTNGSNEMDYVNISYAGSSSFTGDTDEKGNIIIGAYSDGTLNIQNCTISNSANCGIYISTPGSTLNTGSNVTYASNVSNDVCQ